MTPQFAQDMADVLNNRDFDRFDDMFAKDFVNHNPLVDSGVAAFRNFWHGMIAGVPDLRFRLEDARADGDEVMARYTNTGTHTGTFMGLPATGRTIEMATMEFWRFENDVVVEHWDSVNTLEVLQQLGVLPPNETLFAQAS